MSAVLPIITKILSTVSKFLLHTRPFIFGAWDRIKRPDETQDKISNQKGIDVEKSKVDEIQKLNEMLIEYRGNISRAGDDLERQMIVEYSEALNEILDTFDEYNKTLKVIRLESVKRRFDITNENLRGTFENYICKKISFDNPKLTSILKMPAGELKSQHLQEMKQNIFIEAANDIVKKIKKATDDFATTLEESFELSFERAEYSIEEKREAFEKLSETLNGNATAAENVYVKSDYTIAVCSYAEAMIQKEEV